ncbi:hypothetical protein CRX72_04100 [Pantoea sp. BRM17]|nr:hypothetical protein CRX72_04100 [Pantoea sp. BRM17]
MNFRNFEAEEKLFARRALVAFALVVTCFIVLGINLYRLQVRQHRYYQTRSNENDTNRPARQSVRLPSTI